MKNRISRRGMIASSVASSAMLVAGESNAIANDLQEDKSLDEFKITNGRIKQSVMGWCFNPMPNTELAKHCREIGLVAIEGINSKHYPVVKELGLEISLVSSHGFAKGPVNPVYHAECKKKLMDGIDLAVKFGSPSVITFTGMTEKEIDRDQAIGN